MSGPLELKVEAVYGAGETDEFAVVAMDEEGIQIEGMFAPSVGISWEDLRRVINHPFAQEKLAEAEEREM